MSNQQPNPNQVARHYGLDQHHQTFQTQQQAVSQADQRVDQEAQHNWVMKFLAPLIKPYEEAQAKTKYNDQLPNEVRSLQEGLE